MRTSVPDRVPVPMPAIVLGASGVLPLLFGVTLTALSPNAFGLPVARIAIVYGAIILSFLGGIYWGIASARLASDPHALESMRILGWSVVPSLVGWVAVFLPSPIGPSLLAIAFVAVLLLDRDCLRLGYVPGWWMRLRLWLTGLVVPHLVVLALLEN